MKKWQRVLFSIALFFTFPTLVIFIFTRFWNSEEFPIQYAITVLFSAGFVPFFVPYFVDKGLKAKKREWINEQRREEAKRTYLVENIGDFSQISYQGYEKEQLIRNLTKHLYSLFDYSIRVPSAVADTKLEYEKIKRNLETCIFDDGVSQTLSVYFYIFDKKFRSLEDFSSIDSMSGDEFETWCCFLLRKCGFSDVEKTGGSGDQGVDVLAKKDNVLYAIQCKCYSSDLGNAPIQQVFTGKTIYKAHVAVVMTNRRFTKGGIQAAELTGVVLWDRGVLLRMFSESR